MATVYIQPGSSGTGTGTASDPFFYHQRVNAEAAAGAGGTILFTDGEYSFSSNQIWAGTGAGNSGYNITYKSLNPHGAVIKSNTSGTLRQLDIEYPGYTNGSSVQNFKFIDINLFMQNVVGGEVSGNLITTSTAVNIPGNGFLRVGLVSGATKFINNAVSFQYNGGNYFENQTARLAEFSGNTINISDLNGKSGPVYYTYSTSQDLRSCPIVKNNIFITDDTTGNVLDTQNSFSGSVNNCCFFQFDDSNNGSGGTDNVFADPQFVDAPNGDFRLRPSSPCINAGTAS